MKIFIPLIFILPLLITPAASAENLSIGQMAPSFAVTSGDNIPLSLDAMKGKVIIIFYETKDVIEKNRQLKNSIKAWYDNLPDNKKTNVAIVSVINCKNAGFFAGVWKNNLIQNSKKEGLTIYGDWNGKMFSDYNFKDNDSNIIVLDGKGIIKYRASGQIAPLESEKIISLLIGLNA